MSEAQSRGMKQGELAVRRLADTVWLGMLRSATGQDVMEASRALAELQKLALQSVKPIGEDAGPDLHDKIGVVWEWRP